MKLKEIYCTGREVQRLLDITEPQLRTLVANGKLTKHYPPGRKAGLYLRAEVVILQKEWEKFLQGKDYLE